MNNNTPEKPSKIDFAKKHWKPITAAIVVLLIIGSIMEACGSGDEKTAAATQTSTATATSTAMAASRTSEKPAAPKGPSESEKLADRFKANYSTTTWYRYVTDIRVENGNAYVTAQIDRDTDQAIADRLQTAMINMIEISEAFPNVRWVIVEDGSGVVVTQEQVK